MQVAVQSYNNKNNCKKTKLTPNKKNLNVRFNIAPYLTPCGESSEHGECLTWVRLTDGQTILCTYTAFSLDFA